MYIPNETAPLLAGVPLGAAWATDSATSAAAIPLMCPAGTTAIWISCESSFRVNWNGTATAGDMLFPAGTHLVPASYPKGGTLSVLVSSATAVALRARAMGAQ